MTRTPEQVALATNKAYTFNFGEYISQGFNIIGKNPGLFIGFTFVYLLILAVCQFIPFLSVLFTSCLTAGYYIAAHKQEQGRAIEFGDFFKGFDHIGHLILISLIQAGVMIVVMIPIGIMTFLLMDVTSGGDELPLLMIGMIILVMLPIIYLVISWLFAPMLVVFYKMSAWPAMEASRKIISSNWLMFFLFTIVTGFIMMLGFLALGFGILYTMPAVMCMYYAAFRDVVGLPESPQHGTTLMDHLVD